MWRRRLALCVLGVWLVVCLARLTRLIEPPAQPPGQEAASLFPRLRAMMPTDAGYLFVMPGEFGSDTGLGPRLRYELYPRTYDDVRASQDEPAVRALMESEHLRYIVVADASQYPPDHWLRSVPPWLRKVDLGDNSYLLEAVT